MVWSVRCGVGDEGMTGMFGYTGEVTVRLPFYNIM